MRISRKLLFLFRRGKFDRDLEEALRGDCEVKVVLAAERARAAAEADLKRLRGVKLIVLPDALFQSIAGTQLAD